METFKLIDARPDKESKCFQPNLMTIVLVPSNKPVIEKANF